MTQSRRKTLSAKVYIDTHSVLPKMSLFHVKFFFLVVFSPLTRARSSPDVPEVLHMQGTSLCNTEQLPSLLRQTLVHACKFVVSVYNLRSSQITAATNVCWYMLSNHNLKRWVNKKGYNFGSEHNNWITSHLYFIKNKSKVKICGKKGSPSQSILMRV